MSENKPRILIISRNFPPLLGGMERLIFNAYRQLQQSFLCDVIAPYGSRTNLQESSQSRECPGNSVFLFLFCALFKGLFLHVRTDYQIYFAGSGVTSPLAVIFAKLFAKRSVIYLHGLDIVADNWFYQHIFVPFFRYADQVIVNSRNTAVLARQKGVDASRIDIIHPGVDIPPTPSENTDFVQRHGLADTKVLLSVGRIIPRKGLAEFIIHALPGIIQQQPECRLLVIRGDASHALKKSSGAIAELQQAIDTTGLNQHIILLGYADDTDLAAAYMAANVFIFPLRAVPGDVEGFGMVAIEAAAHGLPTVAFNVGGVADAVADGISGALVKPGDYLAFSAKVLEVLATPSLPHQRDACVNYARQFSWPLFGERLRQCCLQTISQ